MSTAAILEGALGFTLQKYVNIYTKEMAVDLPPIRCKLKQIKANKSPVLYIKHFYLLL